MEGSKRPDLLGSSRIRRLKFVPLYVLTPVFLQYQNQPSGDTTRNLFVDGIRYNTSLDLDTIILPWNYTVRDIINVDSTCVEYAYFNGVVPPITEDVTPPIVEDVKTPSAGTADGGRSSLDVVQTATPGIETGDGVGFVSRTGFVSGAGMIRGSVVGLIVLLVIF